MGWAYQQDRFVINCNTNNRVECQNESFKYSYLQMILQLLPLWNANNFDRRVSTR